MGNTLREMTNPVSDASPNRLPPWMPRAIFAFWGVFALMYVGRTVVAKLESLLVMLLVAMFLALAIEPAVNWMHRRGVRRGLATGVVLFGIFLFTLIFIVAIGALVAEQVDNLVDRAPEYVREIQDWLNRTFNTNIESEDMVDRLTSIDGPWQDLASNTLSLSATFANVLFQILGIAMFTFYLVADGPRLRRAICSRLRPASQERVLQAWEVAIDKTGGYIYSRGLLALFSTIGHTIFFTIIGIPNAVALGLWVGLVSQFLPVVGTYLAGILPLLVALVDQPITAVWVLIFIVIYQQFENYFLLPRITARTMDLHAAVAFGAAIAGGALLGPIGAVLALPMAASLQAFTTIYGQRHDIVSSPLTEIADEPPPPTSSTS